MLVYLKLVAIAIDFAAEAVVIIVAIAEVALEVDTAAAGVVRVVVPACE